jgi:hypothetical protein
MGILDKFFDEVQDPEPQDQTPDYYEETTTETDSMLVVDPKIDEEVKKLLKSFPQNNLFLKLVNTITSLEAKYPTNPDLYSMAVDIVMVNSDKEQLAADADQVISALKEYKANNTQVIKDTYASQLKKVIDKFEKNKLRLEALKAEHATLTTEMKEQKHYVEQAPTNEQAELMKLHDTVDKTLIELNAIHSKIKL